MSGKVIDEAALERTCLGLIQAVDRGSHSASAAAGEDHRIMDATVVAIGWMYMDLDRAVQELESAVALQREDGVIPAAPGSDAVALPLITSVMRMIYHGARGRQRTLEGRLARLVEPLDRYHGALMTLGQRHLAMSDPADERVLPAAARGEEPFCDVGVNSLLVQADSDLADVAIHTGYATRQIIARRTRVAQALAQRLWWADEEVFASSRGSSWVTPLTAESLLPLWSGAATRPTAAAMVGRYLETGRGFWGKVPLCTTSVEDDSHDPEGLGQGAVSPLVNWLLIRGLYRYGYERRAGVLNDTLLELVSREGVWEAYSGESGKGLGLQGYAPTAALILDLIKTPYTYERW